MKSLLTIINEQLTGPANSSSVRLIIKMLNIKAEWDEYWADYDPEDDSEYADLDKPLSTKNVFKFDRKANILSLNLYDSNQLMVQNVGGEIKIIYLPSQFNPEAYISLDELRSTNMRIDISSKKLRIDPSCIKLGLKLSDLNIIGKNITLDLGMGGEYYDLHNFLDCKKGVFKTIILNNIKEIKEPNLSKFENVVVSLCDMKNPIREVHDITHCACKNLCCVDFCEINDGTLDDIQDYYVFKFRALNDRLRRTDKIVDTVDVLNKYKHGKFPPEQKPLYEVFYNFCKTLAEINPNTNIFVGVRSDNVAHVWINNGELKWSSAHSKNLKPFGW